MFKVIFKDPQLTKAMKIKLKIWQKIIIFILGAATVIFATIFIFISQSSRKIIYNDALEYSNSLSKQYASQVEGWLNNDLVIARTLSNAYLEYRSLPLEQWQALFRKMYNNVYVVNPHIDAFWDSWELSNLDPKWDKPYGRYFYIVYRENGVLKTKSEIRSLTGDPPTYGAMKRAGKESIAEPYISVLQKGKMMSSLASPIYENGKFIGLIGIDLILSRFQELVNEIKPYPNSYAFLISNKGTFVAHPDTAIYKKNVVDKLPDIVEKFKLLEKIQKGEQFNFTYTDKNNDRFYYSLAPINIGSTKTPWSLGIVVPEREIMAKANRNYNISFAASAAGIFILIIILLVFTKSLTGPINSITRFLQDVAKGKIDNTKDLNIHTGDEIEVMANALSQSLEGLNNKTEFAKLIGNGNLDSDLNLLSEDDILGKSLLDMRDSLLKARDEEEKRKFEDEKVKWTNEGLAKFGDILRQNNNNLIKLGDEIIKNIVWYLNANQGGLFVINDNTEKTQYDLVAAFAYDRKKYLDKSFALGEGLIGTCAAEKDIVYITEIPQDYIEITSGLGNANPNALLLVPLKIEQDVLGVIEIASFNKFESYEIDFIQKLAESIASTLRTVKINAKTTELLQKSQEQAEMMAAQEEEMRQNMEELQATQEEASRKTFELEGLANAINASAYLMEYNTKGYVTSVNDSFQKFLDIPKEDIIGVHHSNGIVMTATQKADYEKFWSDLQNGISRKQTTTLIVKDKEYTLLETYTPIYAQSGEVNRILKIAVDITNFKN